MRLFEQDISELKGETIPGETVFTLYDTYGFPVDLTNDIARERGLSLDYDGYEKAMNAQRERARAASKFGVDYNDAIDIEGATDFVGYDKLAANEVVKGVFVDGKPTTATAGQAAVVVLEETPFYAESGGQAGDQGELIFSGGVFQVEDTKKEGDNHLHVGKVISGELSAGISVEAKVDQNKHCVLTSGHPSPLSANRGYWFDNKHFSRCNDYLVSQRIEGIRW